MKTKLLKQLCENAKEDVYLSQSYYYSGSGSITIAYSTIDTSFGLIIYFYDPALDMFVQDEVVHYNAVEEALPDLQKARRNYILNRLHSEYRELSKGKQKRQEIERLKRLDYQKYLQQF